MNKAYRRVYIEITNLCNLSCSFCPIDQRTTKVMSLDDYSRIISDVAPITDQVCLHLMGEPLAHPQFREIIKVSDNNHAKIQLTTNGLLLKRHMKTILGSQSIVQVNISLQSYLDNNPHKPFEEYLDQMLEFVTTIEKEREDIYINFRLWNIDSDQNYAENEKVFKHLEEKLEVRINRNIDVAHRKSKKLRSKIYLHFDSRFEWPRLDLPFQGKKGRCNGLKDHFAIHSDGSVSPCCLDDQKIINLGNCFEESIDNILKSERAMAIKEGFENGNLIEELCQKCSYINRFKK